MRSPRPAISSVHALGIGWLRVLAIGVAFALLLGVDGIGAQSPAPSPLDSAAAKVLIRLTLKDDSVQFGRYQWQPGISRRIEGRLVGLRPASVDMRLMSGDTITFPVSSVARLDQYAGQGSCRASAGGEALCLIGGVIGGAALGAWAGDKVARQMYYSYEGRQQWRWRGGVAGGLLMMTIVLPVMGRDRWVPVPNWP